jgi:hypothetical protein
VEELPNQKALVNPASRKTPVNVSMELRVLDAVDEEAYKRYGLTNGARSKVIVEILKDHLKIK